MIKIFLDDERFPSDVSWIDIGVGPWVIVRDRHKFTELVQEFVGRIEKVSFDHDLGMDPENTGYKAAQDLIEIYAESGVSIPSYTVHSKNPVGRGNIIGYITSAVSAGFVRN